jgi:DMSO/TMAO reductase YedYZ molybdopterin-dependent catalytic subunit
MPNTIWLNDTAPSIDASTWRLTASRSYTLPELVERSVTRRALLDCTSGWYAEQEWGGVPVRDLIGPVGDFESLLVRSRTGYALRFPLTDLDSLFLAVSVGGRPLSRGHGYPARLVAPGRRGFWWVKWVETLELSATPWWWQSPFPLK